MCGRYSLAVDPGILQSYFYLNKEAFAFAPRYNAAPGQNLPVVLQQEDRKALQVMLWGLIPRWAKEKAAGYKMINARAETIDRKPAFREAFLNRRCLVPADGYFEWKEGEGRKVPMRITLPRQEVFAFAGIWEPWTSPEGKNIQSFSIVTTEASGFLRGIHNRMPVILASRQEQEIWLDQPGQAGDLKKLLQPYGGPLEIYEVPALVNSPRNDVPRCIIPVRRD